MAQLIERQPEWIDDAPISLSNSRRIAASPEAVWARIADHETWPEWFTDFSKVTVTSGAEGVGGGRKVTMPGATVTELFTEWEPNRRFAFTLVEGPPILASMAELVEIEPADDGCTITYRQGIEPAKGFAWLWKPVAKRFDGQTRKALDRLADLLA